MLRLLKDKTTYEALAAYLLGLTMIPYALTKLFRTQFIVLPFHQWSEPLKDISGTTLTWAFLGYSPWFTVLLGLLELVPSVLLLFRKTRLLGAILLLPVVLNVFLINVALDLWQNTQIISGGLLLLNITVLLFHFPLLKAFANRILGTGSVSKIGVEVAVNGVLVGIISYLFIGEVTDYLHQRNFLTGDWYDDRPNVWLVTETLDGDELTQTSGPYEQEHQRYYFHPNDWVTEFSPGNTQSQNKVYQLDEAKRLLKVFTWQKSDTLMGTYTLLNDSTLDWHLDDGRKMRIVKRALR